MKHKFINKKAGAEARVIAMYLDSDGVMQVDGYDTVEDLMDDYAAYEEYNPPKEPLIKDEKMRDLVMTWAKTMGIVKAKGIVYDDDYKDKYTALFGSREGGKEPYPRTYQLDIPYKLDMIEDTPYSIEELCGEGVR